MESAIIMKVLLLNMLLAFAVHADTDLPPSSSPSADIYSPSPSPFTDDDSPAPYASDDSPSPPLPVPEVPLPSPATVLPPPAAPLLPQPTPLPQFPPPEEVDPVAPPPMSCKDQCKLKCAEKRGLRRMFCIGKCLAFCKIFTPPDHAGYHCTRDCVINSIHHQPDIKSIDGLVNTCYSNCTRHP